MTEFPIASASSRYLWFFLPLAVVLIGVMVVVGLSLRGSRTSRFEVTADALRLRGDLYGRTIPRSRLQLDGARRVDFGQEPGLRPKWRRMGTGLPGYQAGWFQLHNGERALVYLTDRSRAVYVPTSDGYSLLLSPADPDHFLALLRGDR